MPSVLTHYGFNKEVFDDDIKFLKNNDDIYYVGAQGPDPFFFYGIVPFFGSTNGKVIRKFGHKLHKKDPAQVFEYFFEYANNVKEKDVLYSYILGAGLHYILDRKIHPYVFYKTGFSDNKKKKARYFADHTLFETHIDVLLMGDRYKDYKVIPLESIKCNEEKIEDVSGMYEKLAKEFFKEEMIDDDSFEESYEQMCKIQKILYSKKGVKKWFAKVFVRRTPLNTMMHPRVVKDDDRIDYLNLKKNKWLDPSTEKEFDKSVYELIDEAKLEAKEWLQLVIDAYNGKKVNLEKFSEGYIYDGRLEGNKMKVFKNVYEKEEENK